MPEAPLSLAPTLPAPDQQAAVIAQVRAALADPNTPPAQRAQAQAIMDRFGRSMLAVGANRATNLGLPGASGQGLSDWLMTHAPGAKPGEYVGRYSPEEMQFSRDLTQAVKPGEYHGAEMAGTAANLGAQALTSNWLLRQILFGNQPGTPQQLPQAPLSPGSQPLPAAPTMPQPSPMGSAPTGPLELPPGTAGEPLPSFLSKPSELPSIDAPIRPMENAYGRFLDNPTPGAVRGIPAYAPSTLQRLIGPAPASPAPPPLPLPEVAPVGPPAGAPLGFAPPFGSGGGRGGPPPASGAPAPPPAASAARHPKGAVDKSGNKIGGQFIAGD